MSGWWQGGTLSPWRREFGGVSEKDCAVMLAGQHSELASSSGGTRIREKCMQASIAAIRNASVVALGMQKFASGCLKAIALAGVVAAA